MSSLYLHIPFCQQKCPYCDFYSRCAQPGELERYVEAVCRDLQASRDWYGTVPFRTVFFGGGTPSLLSVEQVARILAAADAHYGLTTDVEITLEANPGTVDQAKLTGYRAAGVNRLSLGVQSFDDDQLRWLGRRHTVQQAVEAVEWSRQAGFERLSLDLMFALPQSSGGDVERSVAWVRRLAPEHVSIYGLTVEEDTPFAEQEAAGVWQLPDEECYRQAFLALDQQLTAAGYGHYEISNYARPGEECRHNLVYWRRQPYLGIGAGAHSFVDHGWGERWACADSVTEYVQAVNRGDNPRDCCDTFDRSQAMAEMAYLALRCRDGVVDSDFRDRFRVDFADHFAAAIDHCGSRLRCANGRWAFDAEGWLLYNYFIEKFLRI